MRVDQLVEPEGDDELFDADAEALLLRPYMTGDVFVGVKVGDEADLSVMIGGHPCTIRGHGGQLMTRVPCFVLKPTEQPVPYSDWPEKHWDKFPLSDALGLGSNQAARLNEWRSIHKRELLRERRRLTLTERGVYILQQRLTHSLSRAVIPTSEFENASRHILREAELEYEWVSDLVSESPEQREIDGLVREFHRLLDEHDLRPTLRKPGGESGVRSFVRNEIRRRLSADDE